MSASPAQADAYGTQAEEIENAENLVKFEDDSGNTLVIGNRNKVKLITLIFYVN